VQKLDEKGVSNAEIWGVLLRGVVAGFALLASLGTSPRG
jgi:hypothetical protein